MLAAVPVLLLAQVLQRTPPPAPPIPQGQRIEAHDGDTVIVRDGARVRVVRRSEGTIRVVYDATTRSLTILLDQSEPSGVPDGRVDRSYRYDGLDGVWPLGERWQGSAVLDEYEMPQGIVRVGMGITTDAGLIQLFGGGPPSAGARLFEDSGAAAVLHYRSGGGGGVPTGMDFDQAEQYAAQQALRDAGTRQSFTTSVGMSGGSAPGGVVLTTPNSGMAPVRVGGSIHPPQKIVDAKPFYPPEAQAARVQGVVIVEAVIGTDGSVTDARVLRSVALLDQAALDAVRQWKFEPTQVNGVNVPVIMTVTVNFALK